MKDKAEEKIEQVVEEALENQDSKDYGSASDGKSILVMMGVIIALFVLSLGSFSLYNNLTSAGVVTIDDLHQKNLNNELEQENGYIYNGFSFVKVEGMWWTELNKFGALLKVPLHFSPKELEDIELTGNLDPSFNDVEGIYVAIDPKVVNKYYTLAISELSFNIVKGMDRLPVGSCTEETPECEGRKIISCDNSDGKPVVELSLSDEGENKIEFIGSCIKVTGGTDYGIVKSVDRLLYEWYGVMDYLNE